MSPARSLTDCHEVAPWEPPILTPDDARELVGIYRSILNMPGLNRLQRQATEASLSRVCGDPSAIPNLPAAMAAWFREVGAADDRPEYTIATGRALVLELVRSGAGPATWEPVRQTMQDLASLVATLRSRPSGAPEGAGDGPLGEKGSTEGLDWYEPQACPFYSLHGAHGDRLRALVKSLRNAPRYVALEIDAPTRIRFEGPPGTGKTAGAWWIARELDLPLAVFRLDAIGSSWKNRTPRNLRACMEAVVERKGIALIDEIDGLVSRRDKGGAEASDHHVITALFQLLDKLPREQIVIACTNLPDALDPALARRLGTRITFPMPDTATRRAIVGGAWRKMSERQIVKPLQRLIELTDGRSCDTVRRVAHAAAGRAIDAGRDEVLLEDVAAAMLAEPREGKLEPASPSGLLL